MTREEYNQVLAAEPCTLRQLGAVMRECGRLGLDNRTERLAICAELLDLDQLDSVHDLVMGQAGQLLRALQGFADRGELEAAIAPAPTWQQQIARGFLLAAWRQARGPAA